MMKNKSKLEEFIQDLQRMRSLFLSIEGDGASEARFAIDQILDARILLLQDELPETLEEEQESEYDCYSSIFAQLDYAEDMMRFRIKLCKEREDGRPAVPYLEKALGQIHSMRNRYKTEYAKSIYEN